MGRITRSPSGGISAFDFDVLCSAYKELVNGRQLAEAEARKLAEELIRNLTDAIEIDQDLVRHILERSDHV